MRLVVVTTVLAVAFLGCGSGNSNLRMASYNVPRTQLDATVADVIRVLGYPSTAPEVHSTHTDFRVGPMVYDASKQRSTETVETAPEGSYQVTLFIGAVTRDGEGYLDIRAAVFRRERGEWKPQRMTGDGGMTRNGAHVDPFQWDSWIASIADPIYEGVHKQLGSR